MMFQVSKVIAHGIRGLGGSFQERKRGAKYFIILLTLAAFLTASMAASDQMPSEMAVANSGFESGNEDEIADWRWWTREPDMGSAVLTDTVAHEGKRSVLITHNGQRDFAFSNATRFAVKEGQKLTASVWVKCQDTVGLQLAAVALKDGETVRWDIGSDDIWGTQDWTRIVALIKVPRAVDEIYLRFVGSGEVQAWADDVRIEEGWQKQPQLLKPKVAGYADERVKEKLDRGLIAMPIKDNRIYLGWRLLKSDPVNAGFHVYRRVSGGELRKLTDEPIVKTCDFVDDSPVPGVENEYTVRAVMESSVGKPSHAASVIPSAEGEGYFSIPLQGDYTFQKVGIADLNGDGRYDYVIKQPKSNVDPYSAYWKPSPGTYKVEAYLSDGSFLWSRDLGWSIEQGIWYSPMIVHDLDGDGNAEVALKTGPEEDLRDEDGRVGEGPEYLSILDGLTGRERLRVDWPSRDGFPSYNYSSRNQMCVAYLDGNTPCLVVVRGTYNLIKVRAYQYHEGELRELWRWENREGGGTYRGQGAHSMHAVDVDDDGRDEVFLGSAVLDDNGVGLWSSGMGHPDHHYVGDIDPSHPGLEVYYGMETAQRGDGCWLADAGTGERLWGLEEATKHVHASGMCSDIDPMHPGMECYSGERDFPEQKWLWAANGDLIEKTDLGGLSPRTAYWDADLQREIIRSGRIYSYRGGIHQTGVNGSLISVADVLGDWREELIISQAGEMRIYTTTIPAEDRRVCLMQDPIYRMDVAIQAMGYTQMPMTTECLSAKKASMAIMTDDDKLKPGEATTVELVMTAPANRSLIGTVKLEGQESIVLDRGSISVDVAASGVGRYPFNITPVKLSPMFLTQNSRLAAHFAGEHESMETEVVLQMEDLPLTDICRVQAEDFKDQGGGTVQIRDDKVNADGKSISHWDDKGHWLEWIMPVEKSGGYILVVRYCTQMEVRREVAMDGKPLGKQAYRFSTTGGFSGSVNDWDHTALGTGDGQSVIFHLAKGEHTIRMTNVDGNGMNLDYLALYPSGK